MLNRVPGSCEGENGQGKQSITRLAGEAMTIPKRLLAWGLCICGVLLHVYTLQHWREGGKDIYQLGMLTTALSCIPYLVAAVLAIFRKTRTVALGAVAAVLLADLFMHYLVYIDPRGTTPAIKLLYMPLYNLLLIGPAGGLLAWLISRRSGQKEGLPAAGGITPAYRGR